MKELMKWRKSKGHFNSLEEMLQVDNFNISLINSLCSNVLENAKKQKSIIQASNIVKPRIETEHCNTIKTCVSVHIGVRRVSWSRIEIGLPCTVTNWHTYDITEKKLHISDLITQCLCVDKMIPTADCYVLENPDPTIQINTNTGNAEQKNINVEKAQIMAVIGFALANRKLPLYEEPMGIDHLNANVFYMRQLLFSRFFSNVIGAERIACEPTIQKMINETSNSDLMQNRTENEEQIDNQKIYFPFAMQEIFTKASRQQREFLGQCLLLNIAFIRLVLLKDPQSIALITQTNKRSTRKT